jgi:hypothetical protein
LFLGELMQEQSFLGREDVCSHGFWAYPEDWSTWARHTGGDIIATLAPSHSVSFYLFLWVRVSGLLTDHPIMVSANGGVVWNEAIGQGSHNIHFRVRKETLGDRLRAAADPRRTRPVYPSCVPDRCARRPGADDRVGTAGASLVRAHRHED